MVSTTRIVGSRLSDIPVWIQRLLWLDIKGDDNDLKMGFGRNWKLRKWKWQNIPMRKFWNGEWKKKGQWSLVISLQGCCTFLFLRWHCLGFGISPGKSFPSVRLGFTSLANVSSNPCLPLICLFKNFPPFIAFASPNFLPF